MSGLLWTVFGASFLGSLHCAGMCGPFAWLAASEPCPRRSRWPAVAAYHGSRLILYASLGALAGAVGLLVDLGTASAGIQRGAAWLGGISMIAYAIMRLIGSQRRLLGGFIGDRVTTPLTRWLAQARVIKGWRRAALIGAVTSLMPCGWLYAFVLAATGTGNPFMGSTLMIAFWLGTVPILALVAFGMGRIAAPIAARVPALLAIVVLCIGIYTLTTRSRIDLSGQGSTLSMQDAALEVQSIEQDKLPCCAGEAGRE